MPFFIKELTNWVNELGTTLAPQTDHSSWVNGRFDIQNEHFTPSFGQFLSENCSNLASLAPKIAFAHNTSVNIATGSTRSTRYEIEFGLKPQKPLSLRLGLLRVTRKLFHSDFRDGLPPHSHNIWQTITSLERLLHE